MAEVLVSDSRFASRGKTAGGRLFVLALNAVAFDEYGWLPPTVRKEVAEGIKDKQHKQR
jgi:hypothetical protein